MRILFLEDNLDFAEPIVDAAKSMGHTIDFTSDIPTAVSWFNSRNYDAVISDIHFKNANSSLKSGLDLVFHIRRKKKSNIVIVMTTGLELLQTQDIKEYGVDIFYHKPVRIGLLNLFKEIEEKVQERKAKP